MTVDWGIVVLVLFVGSTIVAFIHRRTRIKILYYAWLAMMWLEVEARKARDRSGGDRDI